MMFPLAPSRGPEAAANAKRFGEQGDLRASRRLARPLRCPVVERIFAAAVLGAWLDAAMLPDTAAEPTGPASDPDMAQVP